MLAAAALQASGAARAANGASRTIRQDRMRIMRVYFFVCIGSARVAGLHRRKQNSSAPPVALYALACASNRGKSPGA